MRPISLSGFYTKHTGRDRYMTLNATLDGFGRYHVMITRHRKDRGEYESDGNAEILLVTTDRAQAREAMARALGTGDGWLHSRNLPGGSYL
jgi:hypothetical protein